MLAIVLAPAVVVSAVPVVQAATITTTAATVGARAAAPAVATTCASGGPVTWAICGAAAIAIGVGVAYVTRDTWMPWLGLGAGDTSTTLPDVPFGSNVTVAWDRRPAPDEVTGRWTMRITSQNTANSGFTDTNYQLVTVCKSNASDVFTTVIYNVQGRVGFGQSLVHGTITTCSPESQPISVHVLAVPGAFSSALRNVITWTSPAGATRAPESASDQQKADAAANAARMNFRVEMECKNGASTQIVTVVSQRAPVLPSCADRLGAGWVPVRSNTWGSLDPGAIKAFPPQTQTYTRDTLYPDCAATACSLAIRYRGNLCLEGASGCTNWTTGVLVNPADYSCRYGPYTLSIDACAPIERLYEPGGALLPATGPNTDGRPDTQTAPSTQPSTGTPVLPLTPTSPNPTGTGNPNPTGTPGAAPNPNPDPLTNPGAPRPNPTGAPQPGTVTDPLAPGGAPGPGGDPLGDAANSRCWPNGWGWFNPAEWVARPIACAFVPSPATSTRLATLTTELQQRPPYTVVSEANGLMQGLSGIDGQCWVQDVSVPFPSVDNIDITLLDTCTPGKMEGIVMSYRGVLSAVLWIAIVAPLVWWFWREYAPGSKGVA